MSRTSHRDVLPIDAAGLALVVAIAAIAYFALVGPILDKARDARASSVALATRLEEVGALRGELARAEARAREARLRVEQAPLILRPLGAMNARLSELTDLAVECALSIEALTPGQPVRQERLVRVPVRLAGRGRYADCVRFLGFVHDRFPDVDIDGFRLVSMGEGDAAAASFSIDCAWLAAREGASTAPTPPKG